MGGGFMPMDPGAGDELSPTAERILFIAFSRSIFSFSPCLRTLLYSTRSLRP